MRVADLIAYPTRRLADDLYQKSTAVFGTIKLVSGASA
jgi:hypothetical protein